MTSVVLCVLIIVPPKSIERQLRGWLAKAGFGRSILIRKNGLVLLMMRATSISISLVFYYQISFQIQQDFSGGQMINLEEMF